MGRDSQGTRRAWRESMRRGSTFESFLREQAGPERCVRRSGTNTLFSGIPQSIHLHLIHFTEILKVLNVVFLCEENVVIDLTCGCCVARGDSSRGYLVSEL